MEGGPAERIWADAGAPAVEEAAGVKRASGDEAREEKENEDLSSVYERIRANKAKAAGSIVMGEDAPDGKDGRPDPGFRIYHEDPASGKTYEVPPYTSPAEFFRMRDEGSLTGDGAAGVPDAGSDPAEASPEVGETATTATTTFDGYTAIREAYGEGATDEETAEATRAARLSNRVKTSEIDESRIGAAAMPKSLVPPPAPSSVNVTASDDLEGVYEKIRANKASASSSVEMSEYAGDARSALPFTIYHVDSNTGDVREVPQYTSPGEFFDMIERGEASVVDEDMSVAIGSGEQTDKEQEGWVVVNGGDGGSEEAVSVADGPAGAEPPRTPAVSGDAAPGGDVVDDGSDEKTYDGYQAIQAANGSASREEELSRMREARTRNRSKRQEGGGIESSALPSFE